MRRKKRRNGGVIIDLTSLLDVIFIVLLVVICYASSLSISYDDLIDDTTNINNELTDEKGTYHQMNDNLKNLTEFVGVIVIRVPFDEDDYTKRTVQVLENGEDEIQKFEIAGNRKVADQSELYEYLEGYIAEHDDGPVVISLNDNDDDILYRDEVELKEMITKLKEEHDNIYEK